jgi:cob(I)alamin adenosyltransferase
VVPLVREGTVDAEVLVFLNRLSDLLFVMARAVNRSAGVEDVKWIPAP